MAHEKQFTVFQFWGENLIVVKSVRKKSIDSKAGFIYHWQLPRSSLWRFKRMNLCVLFPPTDVYSPVKFSCMYIYMCVHHTLVPRRYLVNITWFFISFRDPVLTTVRLEFVIIFYNQQKEEHCKSMFCNFVSSLW